ncbi:hypothetical protein Goshw_028329, partial [Gossypium schwendimanii]|nr:hypothetical protein [Gossypium schwendimanii]
FWRLSLSTRFTAYVPFTPSPSEEHLPSPRLTAAAGTELARVSSSSPVIIAHSTKELYEQALPFFTHAILLDWAFTHCPRFPTAVPCGSPGRVSVSLWLII